MLFSWKFEQICFNMLFFIGKAEFGIFYVYIEFWFITIDFAG